MITENSKEEISLKQLFIYIGKGTNYLFSKWYLLFLFGAIGATIGYLYAKNSTPLFSGTTTFILENSNEGVKSGGLSALGGLGMSGIGGTESLFQGESLFELYKSRAILAKTLLELIDDRELFVQRFYKINDDFRKSIDSRPDIKELIENRSFFSESDSLNERIRDSILTKVVSRIKSDYIEVDKLNKKANIIYVTISAEDEEFAKRFNEELVNNVNDFYLQVKSGRSTDNIKMLQYKVDSVRNVLFGAISVTQSTTDNTPNLNPTRQSLRSVPIAQAEVSTESSRSVLADLMRNLEQAKLTLSKDGPIIKIVDNVIYPLPKIKASTFIYGLIGAFGGTFLIIMILSCLKVIRHILNS
ncbi:MULTISPECIES: GumC domain-containing protein [Sphingobacterium]|uniref:Lipopolysaccharide biosynthesis protein n=1 Tax=Sphingobacterium populi TaxID=1812824 RepID=A0ABW5UAQ2_9SPHI|nr:hypothetical protein [Sphingobacterium sp. CFCC 11742]